MHLQNCGAVPTGAHAVRCNLDADSLWRQDGQVIPSVKAHKLLRATSYQVVHQLGAVNVRSSQTRAILSTA